MGTLTSVPRRVRPPAVTTVGVNGRPGHERLSHGLRRVGTVELSRGRRCISNTLNQIYRTYVGNSSPWPVHPRPPAYCPPLPDVIWGSIYPLLKRDTR